MTTVTMTEKKKKNEARVIFRRGWLPFRWVIGFVLGWYIVMPFIVGGLSIFFLAPIGDNLLTIPIMFVIFGIGGAGAGVVTWQLALKGRVPKNEWLWASAAALILAFGGWILAEMLVDPLMETQSLNSGTTTIYTLADGFVWKVSFIVGVIYLGVVTPQGIALWRCAQRAWLVWVVMVIPAVFGAMGYIADYQWRAAQPNGVMIGSFSPYLGWLPLMIVSLPVLSGLVLPFLGWHMPEKPKRKGR